MRDLHIEECHNISGGYDDELPIGGLWTALILSSCALCFIIGPGRCMGLVINS